MNMSHGFDSGWIQSVIWINVDGMQQEALLHFTILCHTLTSKKSILATPKTNFEAGREGVCACVFVGAEGNKKKKKAEEKIRCNILQ